VRFAAQQGRDLPSLTLEELRGFAPQIDADALEVLTLEGSVAARRHVGGTAPEQVRQQVAFWRERLGSGT
jgi:argininosuccinate lyase